jgi:Phosphotransferase enzyme family
VGRRDRDHPRRHQHRDGVSRQGAPARGHLTRADDIQAWLASQGVEPGGPIATIHERPWSTVLRVPTADGDLFLKQEQPLQEYEIPLTVALFARWPDRVPEVVAADTERHWLLTRDGGVRVADSGDFDAFPRALALYGELQVAERAHVDGFLAMGLRDLSLPVVVEAYEPFFERDHGLEPDEVAQLVALAPRYRELCAELEALDLPTSIQHDDLHQWNVFVRGDRVAIYDWGDSSVAFPLWSWLKPSWALENPEAARTAYLTAWQSFASERQLRRALEVSIPTGLFPYALQIRRQYDATQAHADYGTYLPQRLRQLLVELSRARS